MKNKIIEKFLQLTDYTYTYGEEGELEKYLPTNLQKDEFGNYFIEVGESETMFCSHLDTAAWSKEKVQHDFFKNSKGQLFVGTTGETIPYTYKNKSGETISTTRNTATLLGADDKAGVVILLHMIENNIPGLYYFFLGEESGAIGSKGILRKNPEKFSKYKRCVAFDRRAYGSIISRQMGRVCCSSEFVQSLSKEFEANGMKYIDDNTGVFTDSATFMDIIPECTNLSVGYFNEHSDEEVQNLTYLVKLAKAALGIKWETLETKRNPFPFRTPRPKRRKKSNLDLTDDELSELFVDIDDLLESLTSYVCMNWNDFEPEREMIYANRRNHDNITSVYVHENGSISVGREKFATFDDLRDALEAYYGRKSVVNKYDKEEDEEEDNLDVEYCEECGDVIDKNGKCITCGNNINGNKKVVPKKSSDKTSFEEDMDIQDFLYDVINYAYDNDTYTIDAKEMNKILDEYDKTIESLIYWIYEKDNDPNKTYGLTWNDRTEMFEIQDSI